MKAFSIFFISLCFVLQAQTQISGVINDYSAVNYVDVPCNYVTAEDEGYFSVGDRVLLIQMKGATVDYTTAGAAYGNITAPNNVGNYEFNEITFIDVDKLYMKYTLRPYTAPSGSVQVIRVPQYSDVEITGTLTAQAWNGNTGGVLVFEASGTVTINANIDVSGIGFVGGAMSLIGGSCIGFSGYKASGPTVSAGQKGEGISDAPSDSYSGKGKNANGGGGGNDHNCGGGGGSNYGAGGLGGSKSSTCGAFAPNNPGFGGLSLATYYTTNNKIFLGGGGGGGQNNNGNDSPTVYTTKYADKGNGGGIIIIRSNTIVNNGYSILANGTDVYPRNPDGTIIPTNGNLGDGNNGGGAGGTIILDVNTFTNPITISARGGNGGYTNDQGATVRYLGPGGGGGGGSIILNAPNALIATDINGGNAGIARNGTTTTSGAANGSAGGVLTGTPFQNGIFTPPGSCGVGLPITFLFFSAIPSGSSVDLDWSIVSDDELYFILERGNDLVNFQPVATIAKTGAAHYTYRDHMPYSGTSYYRLWYVNNDGRKIYLGVRRVNLENAGHQLSLVPNPSSADVYVNGIDEATSYILQTITGQEIFSGTVHPGETLSIMNLPTGVYLLSLRNSIVAETHRLVRE